jgi:hypothetical protein
VRQAQTLHSLLYNARRDRSGRVQFRLKEFLTVGQTGVRAERVIVDEASMVDLHLHHDWNI